MINSIVSMKTLVALIIACVIGVAGLVFVMVKTDHLIMHDHTQKLLPQIQVEHIARLRLRTHDTTLTFYRDQDGWKIDEKRGYPVVQDRMQEVLGCLAELKILEPKTTNAEYYKMLGVNPVNDPQATGVEVTIWDDQHKEQAQIIVGKREDTKIFVRRPTEIQTWLAQGYVDLSLDLRDWVTQPLLGLSDEDCVRNLTIMQPSGQEVNIAKANINNEDFTLTTAQKNKNAKLDLDAINSLPYMLLELEYADVIPAADLVLDWEKAIKVKLDTFTDKNISVEVLRHDGQILAKTDARPGWYYKLADHSYSLIAVTNEDFVLHN